MKSVKISLEMAQKVKDFVKIVQDYPYEILLKSDKYVVDAKPSSAFSASTSPKPLTVEIYSDDCADLLKSLEAFA